MLDEARDALDARDGPRLRRMGHTIKGCCGYFAASSVYALAQTLEKASAQEEFELGRELLCQLESALQRIEPELRDFLNSRTTVSA